MIDRIINLRLLAQPLNWGIVLAILTLASVVLTLAVERNGGGACSCNSQSEG